jgi:hypothetical protein
MSDGREVLGHGTAGGGAAMLGGPKGPQLSLLVATATHWRPMGDGRELEEFERD